MAIFGKKKATEDVKEEKKTVAKKATVKKTPATKTVKAKKEKEVKEVAEVVTAKKADEKVTTTGKSDYSYRITEKASRLSDKNVYVLNVPKDSSKTELKKDIQKKYKVTVLDINIVNSPKKTKIYRGRIGQRGGGKKAYITLKAGDSIVL